MIGTQSWRPSEGDLPYRAMLLSCQRPMSDRRMRVRTTEIEKC